MSFSLTQEVCIASVVNVFRQPSLRNFVFDSNSGYLYVGGINAIYRLRGNLDQDAAVVLGPHQDIVNCADPSILSLNCTLASVTADSDNKALVLDTDSEVLIACGTLYYGSCAKINTADFSVAEYIYRPVVPNDGSKSVVVVIAPSFTGSNALYVGAAYSSRGVDTIRNKVGLFSVRNLLMFDIASKETSSSSFVPILPTYQNSFAMHFIRALHFNRHVYFFFRRPRSLASDETTSHVLRICTDDRQMHSVVELRLQCSVNNVIYPYLRDITLTDFTPPLQIQDDSSVTGPTLAGVFSTTEGDSGSSVVCLYQMSGVEVSFQSAIQNCFNGIGSKGPEYIVAPETCTSTVGGFEFFTMQFPMIHLVFILLQFAFVWSLVCVVCLFVCGRMLLAL